LGDFRDTLVYQQLFHLIDEGPRVRYQAVRLNLLESTVRGQPGRARGKATPGFPAEGKPAHLDGQPEHPDVERPGVRLQELLGEAITRRAANVTPSQRPVGVE